ncbi:MAG: AAA family ATPase [Acidobacteria bacterium]|nr:AAA family ATPase [Acidobacteriota bacterium]
MPPGYESFFGLFERPFSLTPDARYHFRSRTHARALAGLSTGLARGAPLLLLTGDLGTGKSTLCRALARTFQRDTRVSYVTNALLSPDELLVRLCQDLGAVPLGETGDLDESGTADPGQQLASLLRNRAGRPPLVLIDEAHLLPRLTVDSVLGLAALEADGRPLVQIVLAAQPPALGSPTLPRAIEDSVVHRARLTPLDRDECGPYIQHRFHVAGGGPIGIGARTVDVLFALSGGIPRLVNLLCERALQEAAAVGIRRLEPSMFETAASALELQRLRARRFRWFGNQRAAQA